MAEFDFYNSVPRRFTEVWNCGGGRQSAALLGLIIEGVIEKPALCAMADTGRENSSTWHYLETVLQPAAKSIGLEIVRIPKDTYATVDLWSGAEEDTLIIPAFTTESGQVGKLSNFCTNEWKTRVVDRWLAERGATNVRKWLGFSIDEPKRWMKHVGNDYIRCPLVEQKITKPGCFRIAARRGWPPPVHSSCWMCPNKSDDEWIEQKTNQPGDFKKAVVFDTEMRKRDPHVWLHSSCRPLGEIEFKPSPPGQQPACDSGNCFT